MKPTRHTCLLRTLCCSKMLCPEEKLTSKVIVFSIYVRSASAKYFIPQQMIKQFIEMFTWRDFTCFFMCICCSRLPCLPNVTVFFLKYLYVLWLILLCQDSLRQDFFQRSLQNEKKINKMIRPMCVLLNFVTIIVRIFVKNCDWRKFRVSVLDPDILCKLQ